MRKFLWASSIFFIAATALYAFTPDEYPIPDKMIKRNHGALKRDDVFSFDKAWFKNEQTKQVIVIQPGRDGARSLTIHFNADMIPSEVTDWLELHKTDSARQGAIPLLSKNLVPKYAKLIGEQAVEISPVYFKTRRGLALGMSPEQAAAIMGRKPDTITTYGNTVHVWNYVGEGSLTNRRGMDKITVAEDCQGYQVTVVFRQGRAIAICLEIDGPHP